MFKKTMTIALLIALPMMAPTTLAKENAPTAGKKQRCATPPPSSTELLNSAKLTATSDLLLPFPDAGIVIPIAVHIIMGQDIDWLTGQPAGPVVGDVSDADLTKQIRVLNNAYKGSGFQFALSSMDKTQNNDWFNYCMFERTKKPIVAAMRNALAINPAKTMNVYICSDFNALGMANFPQDYPENSPMHSVNIAYNTLPNGDYAPYNLGKTLIHEVGHYLGLFHTFQGGCNFGNGDGVSDTAFELEPTEGCPKTKDTCPGNTGKYIGKDPVSNYMDYSDDACYTQFSQGQIRLMQKKVAKHRPSLLAL